MGASLFALKYNFYTDFVGGDDEIIIDFMSVVSGCFGATESFVVTFELFFSPKRLCPDLGFGDDTI